MPKISVVIITYNEERNIERCLKSIDGIADEILVVDSFSTDKTEEICKNYNVRFLKHEFEGYIEQKNWATGQATFDHVLSLDADEALSDQLKESIVEVKNNWNSDGYTFSRLTCYCGKLIKHTGWYPNRKLRFWDRRKGCWDGYNPHDKFVMEKGASIKNLKGDLLHYTFYTFSEHIFQINKFSDILSKAYYQRGLDSNYWHILFHPTWRFFRDYIVKLGFLDGFFGFVISLISSFEVFIKYIKLKKLIESEKEKDPFRLCFLSSSFSKIPEGYWQVDNIKKSTGKDFSTIIIANRNAEIISQAKKSRINYVTIRLNKLTPVLPLTIIRISRILKRMRVKTVVVNSSQDAKIAALATMLARTGNVVFHFNNNDNIPDSVINRYIFKNIIKYVFINSALTKYNYHLVPEEKVRILEEKGNFQLSEEGLISKIV